MLHIFVSIVDICWIAYLTENDKGKRIVFEMMETDSIRPRFCKDASSNKSLIMCNGKYTMYSYIHECVKYFFLQVGNG